VQFERRTEASARARLLRPDFDHKLQTMISSSNSLSRGSGMPHQVDGFRARAMSGTELSRVRTEFRLRLPEPINKSPLESRRAGIVMQSSGFHPPRQPKALGADLPPGHVILC
jgi:hypothetical protein